MQYKELITHPVARGIVDYLTTHEQGRFSDMCPSHVSTNLFTYHLKKLMKQALIEKTEEGYTLSLHGLSYVDRASGEPSPKIITMFLVQDGYGKVLLQQRQRQPYINLWTLPYSTVCVDDCSIGNTVRRGSIEELGYTPKTFRHVGDCYIVVGKAVRVAAQPIKEGMFVDGDKLRLNSEEQFQVETRTFVHVVRYETDAIIPHGTQQWVEPLELATYRMAPAVEQIVTRAFFGDNFFFEEFIVRRQ